MTTLSAPPLADGQVAARPPAPRALPRDAAADAEAIYSYEGSNEVNSLIVGRALTGIGAFI